MTKFFSIDDTLNFSKRLQSAGMDKKISEELTKAINDHISRPKSRFKIDHLEQKLDQKIDLVKKDIIIKLGSLMGVGIGILAILIKF